MNKGNFIIRLVLFFLLLAPMAVNADDFEQARAVKGSTITLKFRDIPDGGVLDGEYVVDANDGTIKLPYLKDRVYVAGKTARQVEDLIYRLYVDNEIYTHPIVTAYVGEAGSEAGLKNRHIQVTGYVGSKKNLPYRAGITLIEALLECGDITDYGSRYIQVTRGGQTRTYDYFSARDRSIKLRSDDVIFVPRRGFWEARPDKIGP